MKPFIFIAIFLCLSCESNKILTVDVSQEVVLPEHYIVTRTYDTLVIDGLANENSWENAVFTNNFMDIEGVKIPKYNTKIKMLWDDAFLYVYSEMEEPHIWGNLKQRDTIIYYNNDFEVFVDPSGDGINYGEIEINALNTVWDLFLNKPYKLGGKADFTWNLDSLKSAVKVYGTLNNPSDIDSLWTLELAIPLKPLIDLKNDPKTMPKEGEQWRLNFSRVEWDHDIIDGKYDRKKENGHYLKEYNWVWSNQKKITMHEPEKWGFLQFTLSPSSHGVQFIKDMDLPIKQTAFAFFRLTRFGSLKYLLEHEPGFTQNIEAQYSESEIIKTTLTITNEGFEYKFENPNTKKKYQINNEGILKEIKNE